MSTLQSRIQYVLLDKIEPERFEVSTAGFYCKHCKRKYLLFLHRELSVKEMEEVKNVVEHCICGHKEFNRFFNCKNKDHPLGFTLALDEREI